MPARPRPAVLEYGLAHGLPEILALTHLDNTRSQDLALRIGMEPLGKTDQWYDEPSMLFRARGPQGHP